MTAAERAARKAELRREYRERKARELRDQGDDHGADELLAGRCACACGGELSGAVRQVYRDQRCRQRHHRRRLQRAAEAAGVPARLSLQALQTSNQAPERNGDAPARRQRRKTGPRQGVTVYFPTVELAELAHRHLTADSLAAAAGGQRAPRDPDGELAKASDLVGSAIARRRRRD